MLSSGSFLYMPILSALFRACSLILVNMRGSVHQLSINGRQSPQPLINQLPASGLDHSRPDHERVKFHSAAWHSLQ
jgi:hypothetical protein